MGNVGIGTTDPAYKLDIDAGTSGFGFKLKNSSIRAGIILTNLDYFTSSSGNANTVEVRLENYDGTATSMIGQFVAIDAVSPGSNQVIIRHHRNTGE